MHDLPSPDELLRLSRILANQSKGIKTLARAVTAREPQKLAKAAESLAKAGDASVTRVIEETRAWIDAEKTGRRERLSTALRAACAIDGSEPDVRMVVITKDPLEVRLAPLAAVIDIEHDLVELKFGQVTVATCRAASDELLAARRTAIEALNGRGWEAAAHHRLLRRTWSRLRAESGNEWIELADVLPELALLRQPKAFRADPTGKRFVAYPKANFIYDLWRLRRDRSLLVDGWRLSLGPATGTSAKDKQRVFFVEDEAGQGQFQLTLRFVREEAS